MHFQMKLQSHKASSMQPKVSLGKVPKGARVKVFDGDMSRLAKACIPYSAECPTVIAFVFPGLALHRTVSTQLTSPKGSPPTR